MAIERSIAFLFDLDGVIVDTAILHYKAWRRMANELGFDFSEEQNEALKGVGRMESLEKILSWGNKVLTENEKRQCAVQKNIWYNELILSLTEDDALPGAIDFLERTNAEGIMIGLGSASKNARPVLDRLHITGLFDVIIDGNAIKNSKPDPEVFVKGASGLGVDCTHCAVFEDAQTGIEAALRAGMVAVGIGQKSVLTEADIVYPSLKYASIDEVLSLLNINVPNA